MPPASWPTPHRARDRERRAGTKVRSGISPAANAPKRRREPHPRPSRGRSGRQTARPGNLGGRLFSVGGRAAFTSRSKIVGPLRSSAGASALRFAPGAGPARPPSSVAMKAARVAANPATEHPMITDDDFEPHHSASPTNHVLTELQLYGFRPFQDEPDPRPLPEDRKSVV